ncbi:bacillithiol system redox-active protein YtxJ [Paenibacillus oenotherae]|uniref:Bacillithiol system redox-active protein YtxJ n=1 Tax=Paenibacillus oenotherae TaxID=1435645 RepID=A0ABS7D2T7_9BACL|nr:bacillithiol system redox-active protein YtxJ [Paenibacillus oenotherae]MBW7474213.1 bacillithiol system redox-active protein YtxJ [Paenibacillus oenotherae]
MIGIPSLKLVEQWAGAYEATWERPLLLFKHSTRCPVSAGAYDELANWIEDASSLLVDCAFVYVVEERPVSDAVAVTLGLKHESPQAILVDKGKIVWHASHWSITYSALDEHLGNYCEK